MPGPLNAGCVNPLFDNTICFTGLRALTPKYLRRHFMRQGMRLLALGSMMLAGQAFGQAITPDTTGFGPLPGATFGGTGIPNSAVAQTTVGGVTIGLSATQRFSNPALTNDNAGTFYALSGVDAGSPVGDPYARWNFNYYVGGTGVNAYTYRLFYDFDAGAGTSQSAHGVAQLGDTPSQNSLNLGMNFLAVTAAPFLTAPAFASFNPAVNGEYTFGLVAYNKAGGAEAFRTSILVSAVPEPETWGLMLAGLGVVGWMGRRRPRTLRA